MSDLHLSPRLSEQLQAAACLALKARAAALAGDTQRAAALRAAYDALYDALEVDLFGETTADYLRPTWCMIGSENAHSNKLLAA